MHKCTVENEKHDQTILGSRCGHRGQGHFRPGLHGGIIFLRRNHSDHHKNLPHLMSQHSIVWSSTALATSAHRGLLGVLRMFSDCSKLCGQNDFEFFLSKNDNSNRAIHRYPLPRALFQRFILQTHLDALRPLSAHLWLKTRLSESLHQVIFAKLGAAETTTTTWKICDQSSSDSFACLHSAVWVNEYSIRKPLQMYVQGTAASSVLYTLECFASCYLKWTMIGIRMMRG